MDRFRRTLYFESYLLYYIARPDGVEFHGRMSSHLYPIRSGSTTQPLFLYLKRIEVIDSLISFLWNCPVLPTLPCRNMQRRVIRYIQSTYVCSVPNQNLRDFFKTCRQIETIDLLQLILKAITRFKFVGLIDFSPNYHPNMLHATRSFLHWSSIFRLHLPHSLTKAQQH